MHKLTCDLIGGVAECLTFREMNALLRCEKFIYNAPAHSNCQVFRIFNYHRNLARVNSQIPSTLDLSPYFPGVPSIVYHSEDTLLVSSQDTLLLVTAKKTMSLGRNRFIGACGSEIYLARAISDSECSFKCICLTEMRKRTVVFQLNSAKHGAERTAKIQQKLVTLIRDPATQFSITQNCILGLSTQRGMMFKMESGRLEWRQTRALHYVTKIAQLEEPNSASLYFCSKGGATSLLDGHTVHHLTLFDVSRSHPVLSRERIEAEITKVWVNENILCIQRTDMERKGKERSKELEIVHSSRPEFGQTFRLPSYVQVVHHVAITNTVIAVACSVFNDQAQTIPWLLRYELQIKPSGSKKLAKCK